MYIHADISPEYIVHSLCLENDETSLLQFIKYIDETYGAWDFTEKCYEYFKKEMEGCPS